MTEVVLYGKPGCHLCEEAERALLESGTAFRQVDISRDEGLMNEFGILIPVVEVDGLQVFEAGMDPSDLPELVEAALR